MNNPSMEQWIKKASDQMKTDPRAVKAAIDAGDVSKLTASMSKADMEKVQEILGDQQKMQEILNSPLAKAFLKNYGK